MKKINMLDVLGLTDNEMINRAIETDSAEKLKELKLLEKHKKHSIIFKYASMFAGGFAVLIVGIFLFGSNNNNNNLYSSPMIEVKNISELEKYIDIDLTKFKFKQISEMYKFEDDNLIQIKYNDGSTIRVSKGKSDNSGIYGATLKETKNINGFNVKIYEFEDTKYAVWNDENNNYTYSYISSDNENIYDILSKIV